MRQFCFQKQTSHSSNAISQRRKSDTVSAPTSRARSGGENTRRRFWRGTISHNQQLRIVVAY